MDAAASCITCGRVYTTPAADRAGWTCDDCGGDLGEYRPDATDRIFDAFWRQDEE